MKKKIPAWLALLVICAVCAAALALTYNATKDAISNQEKETALNAYRKVMADADTYEETEPAADSGVAKLLRGVRDDQTVGYIAVVNTKGFGGEVEVTVGVNLEGKINAISVGGSNFSETAGLGAKSKDAAFTDQFAGRETPLKVIKAGGTRTENTIDAITSATITSTAVTGGVNTAADCVKALLGLVKEETLMAGAGTASEQGFGGKVTVTVTVDSEGKIETIVIGDDSFNETEGFGAKALEPEFAAQFIGRTAPLTLEDIDAISGATFTSKAVVAAVNKACEKAMAVPANMASASEQGFGGKVAVTITVDDEGKIETIVIGDDSFNETEGFGAKALEPEFAAQFIGKSLPLTLEDIDAISGATFTSKAVVGAINKAYEKLSGAETPAEEPVAEATDAPAVVEIPAETRTATASEKGFAGEVAVKLTVDAENKIVTVEIGDENFNETAGLGGKALEAEFAAQFVGKNLPITLADIDAIAGATVTSTAVVNAINAAYESLTEEPAAETRTATASEKGFAGEVAVKLTVDAENKIVTVEIGDENFSETAGLGGKALEAEFAAQFVGKNLPITLADIDAIAGATVTSTAVVNAINAAYESLTK